MQKVSQRHSAVEVEEVNGTGKSGHCGVEGRHKRGVRLRPPEPHPSVNRHEKSDQDAAEWLPALNQCWYVDRVIRVRLEYSPTIDQAESDAIDPVLATCDSTEMVVLAPTNNGVSQATATPTPTPAEDLDAPAVYDDNGNCRISCAKAYARGIIRSPHIVGRVDVTA